MHIEKLKAQLLIDEGKRSRVYTDTVGKLTVGVGRNISDRAFSDDEIDLMLCNDIALVIAELDKNAPWWKFLNEARQNVLINMCFNMGWPRLSGFKKFLGALITGRWEDASAEMLSSKWAAQVGDRAKRLAATMVTGKL